MLLKGIGRHAAEYLAKNYPDCIVLAGVRKTQDFQSIEKEHISNLIPIYTDVTSHQSIVKSIQTVQTLMKTKNLPFIALVNNAAIANWKILEYFDVSEAKSLFDTNFFGVLDITQQFLPLLRASKGRIIMMSSISGFSAIPLASIYSASKWAMEALSDGLRRETLPMGISVSVIQPGYIKTDMLTDIRSQITHEKDVTDSQHLYTHIVNEKKINAIIEQIEQGSSPEVTTKVIEHALFNRQPRTR